MTITLAAPAKLNLWLRVAAPGDDGFHDLDTLFCALHLADTVTVASAPAGTGIRLHVGAAPPLMGVPDLGPPDHNLAVRAARAFCRHAGADADLEIRIIKRIPPGGGLGGGSSDAAAVLRALARLHPDVDPAMLHELGAGLGSDVPFFLAGAPLALGAGRGTRLTPCDPLPSRAVVLALPPFGVSTADAYRWLDGDRDDGSAPAASPAGGRQEPQGSWEGLADRAVNDLEWPVFRRHPLLARLRDDLGDRGAGPALMAGSGSTVFGVFPDDAAARAAADALRAAHPGLRTVVTSTATR